MKKNKSTNVMAGILMVSFIGIFLVISGRFFYIQATGEVNDVSLEKWAKEKRTSSYSLPAERGRIYDRTGMTLAYDQPTFRLYATVDEAYSENQKSPKHVVDPEETAEKLANLLEADKDELLSILENGIENDKTQVEFGKSGRGISQQTKDEIEDLNLPGINFIKESMRYYPNGMFASHRIGLARNQRTEDDDGNIEKGINSVAGIERDENELLNGKDGFISFECDKYNKKLLDPNEVIKKPVDGQAIYLTIDQKIQTLLEDVMTQVDEEYSPERISAIVMNAKSGEIIAMGNRPSYNPRSEERRVGK